MELCENLLRGLPAAVSDEVTDNLLSGEGSFRMERIVSQGQASPPGFWYDQDEHEWVLLLAGAAEVLFAGESDPCKLVAGDSLKIPAHRRHRVSWTQPDVPTVWLALFWS